MDWKFLKKTLPWTTLIAFVFATIIAVLTPIPFWIAACLLLFSWPVTDIIIEAIAARNPATPGRMTAPNAKKIIAAQLMIIGAVAFGVAVGLHIPYVTAFSGVLLVVAPAGSINSILAEREDNAPGGFNNPLSGHKEPERKE